MNGFGETQVGRDYVLWTLRRGRFSLMLWLHKDTPDAWLWLERRVVDFEDRELLRMFKEVERLDTGDKAVIKKLIDAFLLKKNIQRMAAK